MRHAMLLVAVLVAQPAAAPQDDFKAIFAKHWRMAKEFTLAVAEAMPAERLGTEVYKFQGQPVLAHEALWYTFTHMAHHRGQAEVYLRVKNITPPAWRF